jgi:argininosuccinate lyase
MTRDRRANGLANGKAWSGRFREPTHRLVEAFTSSVTVDRRLYAQDIQGSIAHCKTLEKARVLTQTESRTIVRALETVKLELDRGKFKFSPHDEDIHMAVERRLTELIGPLNSIRVAAATTRWRWTFDSISVISLSNSQNGWQTASASLWPRRRPTGP